MKSNIKNEEFNQTTQKLMPIQKSDTVNITFLAFSFPISALSNFPKESIIDLQAELITDLCKKALKFWVNDVLGFEMSPTRGRGCYGYKDSMTLSSNGEVMGLICLGGQRDTIFFQISDKGCKHLFSHITPSVLHHWLSKTLTVSKLSRIDLAIDNFDGDFDCNYAVKAHKNGLFRTSSHGRYPEISSKNKYSSDTELKKEYRQEMILVGSRKSIIHWRIYNKKLQQGIKRDNFYWYRSEVELKKLSVDSLLDLVATFADICPFAASFYLDKGVKTKAVNKATKFSLVAGIL
ncbi:replication initiation factor domain-containing protein [Colwellia sp. 20A7]|uniref:replication initiation factor domain-containing protein n=1 Tax=Colwellia sp. 20A7 TaxID=2689569 RepID=UPI0013572CB7|nr:replication initiation factor domain-containing protein [Colwellia sp. 20A7]